MKKDVILMAAILATAAGCTHQGGYGRASNDPSPDPSAATMGEWDAVPVAPTRNPDGSIRTPAFTASEVQGKPRIDSELSSNNAIKADRVEPYQGSSQKTDIRPYVDPRMSLSEGSANWNPSDDLLKDGVGRSGSIQSGTGTVEGDLNPTKPSQGSYSVGVNRTEPAPEIYAKPQSGTEEDAIEGDAVPEPQIGVTGSEPQWRYKNNRANGVGSGATGEFGIATFGDPLSNFGETTLSEKVKEQLALETTGTQGLTRNDIVRNIKVESHAGVVTLKGSVPTENDRKMIEVRAAEIKGVQKVNNELIVSEESNPAERD